MNLTDWNVAIDFLTDNRASSINDEYIKKAYEHIRSREDIIVDFIKVDFNKLPDVTMIAQHNPKMPQYSTDEQLVIGVALAILISEIANNENEQDKVNNVFEYIQLLKPETIVLFSKVLFVDLNCKLTIIQKNYNVGKFVNNVKNLIWYALEK